MTRKLEPTSDMHGRVHATSFLGEQTLELGVAPEPQEATFSLRDRYGIPLLEVLVVDQDYIFLSWEITTQQLAQARELLGDSSYRNRRLIIRFHDVDDKDALLLQRELYGEAGRWFLRIGHAGCSIRAELGYLSGDVFHQLISTGPIHLPRAELIEPDFFEEMEVSYGYGAHGRLIMLGTARTQSAQWPECLMPIPGREEYSHGRMSPSGLLEGATVPSRAGSSLDLVLQRPSSVVGADLSLEIKKTIREDT